MSEYNPNYEQKDPIALIIFKIFIAFVGSLELLYVFKPIMQMVFGNIICTGCGAITIIFLTTVLPIAFSFIMIYCIISIFTAKIGR